MKSALKNSLIAFICLTLGLSLFPGQAWGEGPSVSAQSAVLIDQSSGRELFEKNSHEKLPIASITKVMTAILAIESGKMNQMVTVSDRAIKTEGSSLYLKAGERLHLKDLVYGLMLRSGNDASLAIAEAVAGSEQGFAFMMNEKAQELGMQDTHFTNPNGLENSDHYSTASDMAVLTRYAMENQYFRKIAGTRSYRAAATNKEGVRVWKNKNKMLSLYQYATGGKTGFTKKAGRTLISTASQGNMSLIAVTLNDGDDWLDHKNLFEWGFSTYKPILVVRSGKLAANTDPFYQNHLYVQRDIYLPLSKDEQQDITKKLILIKPPAGDKSWTPPSPAGRLLVMLDQRQIYSLPVYYKSAGKEKRAFWKIFFSLLEAFISGREQPLS
ncbi:D-alanyl-D-alanine carboxypeptidase family protein [Sporolactobacillus pectinivorans]|uniref:D-alanyl-D-alanine carboxypeptidase family protein n=1 Tax=Sporolactobacillus pectinivorans TaxID=1591408 RepID=UPI000C26394D|nr:D-alanyl-D-alanine carboxypeptidase family protein [Sporolactobacillus pectinivorans]